MLGGSRQLRVLKRGARERVGLEPVFPENRPARPLIIPSPNYDPRYMCVCACTDDNNDCVLYNCSLGLDGV